MYNIGCNLYNFLRKFPSCLPGDISFNEASLSRDSIFNAFLKQVKIAIPSFCVEFGAISLH